MANRDESEWAAHWAHWTAPRTTRTARTGTSVWQKSHSISIFLFLFVKKNENRGPFFFLL